MSVSADCTAAKTNVDQAMKAIDARDVTALETAMCSEAVTNGEMIVVMAYAARKGCIDMVRALSRLGAEVTSRNRKLALALVKAADDEDWELVKCLADLGVALNFRNRHGECALSMASFKGPMVVIECLVQSGANVNLPPIKSGRSPLTAAVVGMREDVMRYLLNWGANPGGDKDTRNVVCPMQAACKTGDVNIVKCLIEAGARVKNTKLVPCAAQSGKLEVVKLLVEAGADLSVRMVSRKKFKHLYVMGGFYSCRKTVGEQALMNAVKRGHDEIVDYLLTCDIGSLRYVLSEAIQTDRQVLLKRIYESSVDRQLLSMCYNANFNLVPPLVCAVQCGSLETVQLLTEAGADVNQGMKSGRQPLAFALAYNRDIDMIQHLITCGADLNPGHNSERPLHEVIPRGADVQIVQCLLNAGADPTYKNCSGNSALDVHLWTKIVKPDVVECLLRAGCPYEQRLSNSIRTETMDVVLNLVKAGASPIAPLPNAITKDSQSPIRLALLYGKNDTLESFLKLLFFDYSDFIYLKKDKDFLKLLSTRAAHFSLEVIDESFSQPWKLSCLSFLAVSSCVGYGLARRKRVPLTGLPPLFQRQLLFEITPNTSETWQSTLLAVSPH